MASSSWLTLLSLAVACAAGCGRCGGDAPSAPSPSASVAEEDAAPTLHDAAMNDAAAPSAAPALPADVPEIKDDGAGRATAALRAVLTAYGISFDAAALERECKVDDDGASIDDLEDVAVKHGLEAGSIIVPAEHLLLAATKMLPAIVITDTAEDEQEFVVAWRVEGERVQVMDPIQGRTFRSRAELEKSLHVHEMTMPLDEYREAIAEPAFLDGLEARMAGIGVARAPARALIERATADPGWRGLGALDASIRKLTKAGVSGADSLTRTFDCALDKRCDGADSVPLALWSVRGAPTGEDGPQVNVRGAVLLAIGGRGAAH